MTNMRIGISPLSWTNQSILELGDHISYETCITEAAKAGFTGVELGRKFPTQADSVVATLAEVGLVPVTAWYSGFLAERPLDQEWPVALPEIQHLASLGCSVMVYGECAAGPAKGAAAVLADTPPLSSLHLAVYAKRITEFAERIQEYGLTLVYHPHVMMPVETIDEIDHFMQAVGEPVRLLLDTGHLAMAGDDYRVAMNTWWDRIAHIHLKDIRYRVYNARDPQSQTFDELVHEGIFTVPGDGDLDFEPVIKKIASDGYSGWLMVEAEQDPLKANPLTMANTSFAYLANLLEKHGIGFDRNPFNE